ncbi:hypothetical protein LXL04_023516 [Taraxacum kok-saghyz]
MDLYSFLHYPKTKMYGEILRGCAYAKIGNSHERMINMLDWCLSYHQMIQNPNSVVREELDLQNPDSVLRGESELELEFRFLQCIDVDQDLEPMENNIVGLDMEDGCLHPGGSTDPLFYQQTNSGIPDSNTLNPESYYSLLMGTESDDFNALSAGT